VVFAAHAIEYERGRRGSFDAASRPARRNVLAKGSDENSANGGHLGRQNAPAAEPRRRRLVRATSFAEIRERCQKESRVTAPAADRDMAGTRWHGGARRHHRTDSYAWRASTRLLAELSRDRDEALQVMSASRALKARGAYQVRELLLRPVHRRDRHPAIALRPERQAR